MKQNQFIVSILSFLFLSCGQSIKEDSFRKKIDDAKKEIQTMDVDVSSYAVDSSKYWNVISQITARQQSGKQSTIMNSEFKRSGKLIKRVSSTINQKAFFQGQIITTDFRDKISLCYLLADEQNIHLIFRISCNVDGDFSVEKIDSSKSNDWAEIKSLIIKKNL